MTARMSIPDRPVHVCPVRDVGLGGVYVQADGWLRAGQICALEFKLNALPESPMIEACGRVVRVETGGGTAIQFTQLSLEAFDRLDRIVFDRAPAPQPAALRSKLPVDSSQRRRPRPVRRP